MRPLRSACWSGSATCSCPLSSANVAGRYLRYRARLMGVRPLRKAEDPPHTRQSLLILAAFRPWGGSQDGRRARGLPRVYGIWHAASARTLFSIESSEGTAGSPVESLLRYGFRVRNGLACPSPTSTEG